MKIRVSKRGFLYQRLTVLDDVKEKKEQATEVSEEKCIAVVGISIFCRRFYISCLFLIAKLIYNAFESYLEIDFIISCREILRNNYGI